MEQPKTGEPRVERRISSNEHRAAYQAAKDSPADHKPKLITSRSVAGQVHGAGAVGRFNTWLAVLVTRSVGTMWAAYLFTVISVGGAVAVITNNAFWTAVSVLISQTFLQLVLLSIIIVGQNVLAAASDKRAEATYQDADAVLHTALQIQDHLAAQDGEIEKILAGLAPLKAT